MRISISLLIVLFFICSQLIAGTNDYQFRHINTGHGLSGSQINDIEQDSKGFLWITTNKGLNRYDGYSMKSHFSFQDELQSMYMTCVAADKDLNLWIGTLEGLIRYTPSNNSYKLIGLNKNETASVIHCIVPDSNYSLWIGTNVGLYKYDIQSQQAEKVLIGNGADEVSIHDIIVDEANEYIWVASSNGLYCNDISTGRWLSYKNIIEVSGGLFKTDLRKLFIDSDNNLWICSYKTGVCRYNISRNEVTFFNHLEENYPDCICADAINVIEEDCYGRIWMGSRGHGITVFDKKNNSFQHLKHNIDNNKSLAWDVVLSLLADKEGGMWIGTYGAGISYWHPNFNTFDHIGSNLKKENNLNVESIYSIFDDGEGEMILCGFGKSSLDVYDRNTAQHIKHQSGFKGMRYWVEPDDLDADSVLWLGSHQNEKNQIYKYDRLKKKVIAGYNLVPYAITVYDIFKESENTLWVASDNGAFSYNVVTRDMQHYQHFSEQAASLSNNTINCIIRHDDNHFWLASNRGLNLLDRNTGICKRFLHDSKDSASINSNLINDLYQADDSILWLATGKGLSQLHIGTGRFKPYQKDLINTEVKSIQSDGKGNLWISMANNILYLDIPTGRIVKYDSYNGIQNSNFNRRSGFINKNGEVFFGGSKGVTIVNPENIFNNSFQAPVFISQLEIDSKIILEGEALNMVDTLRFSDHDKLITFELVVLSYQSPEQNQYAYKLEGLSKQWNYIGQRRHISFSTLPSGTYYLLLKGAGMDGVWNEKPHRIVIIIEAPFYKTTWFVVLAASLTMLIIFFVYWLSIEIHKRKARKLEDIVHKRTKALEEITEQLQERNEEILLQTELLVEKNKEIVLQKEHIESYHIHLEETVKKRTKELEIEKKRAEQSDRLKSSFLMNMSHEIRTPMNAIVGFSNLLNFEGINDDERKEFTQQIQKNCDSLLMLIDDIMDLSLIEAGQLKVKKERIDLNQLMHEVYNQYLHDQDKSEKNIEFMQQIPAKTVEVVADALRIRQVLSNLLNNAFKYTETGQVELGFRLIDEETVTIFVNDTGIGISRERLQSIFRHFGKMDYLGDKIYRGTGLGLSISQNLVSLMGSNIQVNSTEGVGSDFYFNLPVWHELL